MRTRISKGSTVDQDIAILEDKFKRYVLISEEWSRVLNEWKSVFGHQPPDKMPGGGLSTKMDKLKFVIDKNLMIFAKKWRGFDKIRSTANKYFFLMKKDPRYLFNSYEDEYKWF